MEGKLRLKDCPVAPGLIAITVQEEKPRRRPLKWLFSKLPVAIKNWIKDGLHPHIKHISFIAWHYIYFLSITLVASLIFWGSSTPARSVRYIDAYFLSVSAMTEAGLNTINLSEL
jgi:hypothetical protein